MEGNPLMRPFVKSGRPILYAVQSLINAGVIFLSYKMKQGGSKLWWVMPVALTAGHSVAGTYNIRLALTF